MVSAGERAYIGVCGGAPSGVQGAEPRWRVRGQPGKAPEAESSVAFEAPVEEPNLTLVTDSFLQFI